MDENEVQIVMPENQPTKISITIDRLNAFFEENVAFHGLPRGRISKLLLTQLYIYSVGRIYNIFAITDEIKYLEGQRSVTLTGKEEAFKGNILCGLWKKHFFDARFFTKNIANHWSGIKGRDRLMKLIESALAEAKGDDIDRVTIGKIAHHSVFDVYAERTARSGKRKGSLTGEWIIFAKHGGNNYYLCIGYHGQDESIKMQISNICYEEFPFLFQNIAE